MTSKKKATIVGFVAIVLWASMVGLLRGVSEDLGPIGGAAMIYTVAAMLLFATLGLARLRELPKWYLWWGGVLFVSYELCWALSIGYATSGQQAIEVSMVNYLWPSLTMVAAVLFNGQRATWMLLPGLLISILGICWVLGGEQGVDVPRMLANIQDNPLSYGLALMAALTWAAYCTITARVTTGKSAITLFFTVTASVLWVKYAATGGGAMNWSSGTVLNLVMASAAIGFGYAAWNVGIMHGSVSLLVGASYFTPVLSTALAAVMLNVPLAVSFWLGVLTVCCGAILSWGSTRSQPQVTA